MKFFVEILTAQSKDIGLAVESRMNAGALSDVVELARDFTGVHDIAAENRVKDRIFLHVWELPEDLDMFLVFQRLSQHS